MTSVLKITTQIVVLSLVLAFIGMAFVKPLEPNIVITDDPAGMMNVNPNAAAKILPDSTTLKVSPKHFKVEGKRLTANKITVTVQDGSQTVLNKSQTISGDSYTTDKIINESMVVGKWYTIKVSFTYPDSTQKTQKGKIRRLGAVSNNNQSSNTN